ncbi:hypothetical protein VTI74DRAFT_37 [Chaetomium olivicolor]
MTSAFPCIRIGANGCRRRPKSLHWGCKVGLQPASILGSRRGIDTIPRAGQLRARISSSLLGWATLALLAFL